MTSLPGSELQTLYAQRRAPISFEWTVPCGCGYFHLGVHNLPPASADAWFARLAGVTAAAFRGRRDGGARAISTPTDGVLLVLNHPQWDLAGVGRDEHTRLLREFLDCHASRLHALELNGYRSWKENASVQLLAETTNLPLISGGDRHGAEPNALLNLSHAQIVRASSRGSARRRQPRRRDARVSPASRDTRGRLGERCPAPPSRPTRPAGGCGRIACRGTPRAACGRCPRHWPDGGPLWVRSAIRAFNMAASPAGLRVMGAALDVFERVTARETFRWTPSGRPGIGALGVDAN